MTASETTNQVNTALRCLYRVGEHLRAEHNAAALIVVNDAWIQLARDCGLSTAEFIRLDLNVRHDYQTAAHSDKPQPPAPWDNARCRVCGGVLDNDGDTCGECKADESAEKTTPRDTHAKQPWELTRDDLTPIPARRFPRGSYRGELRDANDHHVANVYVVDHRVYIGAPKEYGNGEVTAMIPGSFDPKTIESAGGMNVSAGQRVKFWRFKQPSPAAA